MIIISCWRNWAGESGFSESETDDVGEPSGGGKAGIGEAIEVAKVDGIGSVVKGAGLSTFLKYIFRLDLF